MVDLAAEKTATKSSEPIISIRHVGKQFAGVRALNDVTFDIERGELHAIMGENGAGKSTLMKILSGVLSDYEGELWVNGQHVSFSGTQEAEAAGISIIHQELNMVDQLSVSANIFLGRELTGWFGLRQQEMDRRASELLEQLESNISSTALVSTLRIGDQQLVEIAKAISLRSEILIMDEPTSALTEHEVARLYGVIDRLRERGVTILYISHKMDEVFRLADRITVLRDGQFIKTISKSDTNPREIAHLMVGRDIAPSNRHHTASNAEVVLEVRNLTLAWPEHPTRNRLNNISLQVRAGEVLGIAGLMGAGRTELLECLYGASSLPPQGEILLHGQRKHFRHPREAMAAGIAMVTEDRKRLGLFAHQTVRENISVSYLSSSATAGVVNNGKERQAVADQIQQLLIKTAGAEAAITSLSGGNQQKCIIGRCMLTKPKLLLLDDPTRGVDIGAKAELYRLMEQLARQGMAIIATSSELPELLTVSDRIVVLSEGELTGHFTRSDATEQKIMEAATKQNRSASLA